MDGGPFFRGTSPPRFFRRGLFISDPVLFRFGDNLQADRAAAVKGAQRLKDGRGKEIPVQQKQTVPERLGGPVSIPDHFQYMGGEGNGGSFPCVGGLEAIMETDAQGDAGPVSRITGQDAKATEHMAMDVLRLGGIFRLLKKFLYPWHAAPLFWLFDAIPDHDMEGSFLIDGEIIFHNGEPAETDGIQRPGGGPEKVDQGRVAVRGESQVTDNGGDAKIVRAEHKAYGNGNKPTEGGLP